MAGFDLAEGSYIKRQLTEDELWSINKNWLVKVEAVAGENSS